MKKYYLLLIITSLFIPTTSIFADRGYWGDRWEKNSAFSKKVDKLDDDPAKEVPIPVLLGIDLNDITPNFGAPRGGGTRSHEGLDIMSITGTPIVSPTKAVVRNTGFGASAGNYVYTINPGGEVFAYLHLDEIADDLEPGDVLEPGDFIGTIGYSGNAVVSAPHLHFEIQVDGKATDPYDRVNTEFSSEEKIGFLENILDNLSKKKRQRLSLLVTSYFQDELKAAEKKDVDLPEVIENTQEEEIIISDINVDDIECSINYTRLITLWKRGNDVKQVQRCMNSLGFSTGIVDGIYGPNTYRGITNYQRATGLKYIDGIVGPETSAALNLLGEQ